MTAWIPFALVAVLVGVVLLAYVVDHRRPGHDRHPEETLEQYRLRLAREAHWRTEFRQGRWTDREDTTT